MSARVFWSCLAALTACTPASEPAPSEAVVRDSAGVEIVVSRHAPDLDRVEWSIDGEPSLTLHSGDDAVLHWIRGAVRQADGTIVLVSESSDELLFFGSDGTFERRVGREGDGPGEFRGPFFLRRIAGDTLVVTDRTSGRISWFDAAGEFVRQEVPNRERLSDAIPDDHAPGLTRWLGDDLYLTTTLERGLPAPRSRVRPEVGAILHRGREPVSFLGPFPGREYFRIDEASMGRWAFFPNQTEVVFGTDPARVYVGNTDPFEIRVFRADGSLERIIRDSLAPEKISEDDIAWERWELLDWGEQSDNIDAFTLLADAMPIPDSKPAFETITIDPFGYLWLKEYHGYSPEAADYRIYDPAGLRVGRVQLPGRFVVHEIGADYVLGVEWSLAYEETVKLFPLRRPSG